MIPSQDEWGAQVVRLHPAAVAGQHGQSPATRYAGRVTAALNAAAEALLDAQRDNDDDEDADPGRLPAAHACHLAEGVLQLVLELPDVAAIMRAGLPAGPEADRAHRLRLALQRIAAETSQLTADLAAQATASTNRQDLPGTGGTS
jgi:hypothetical protein